MIINELVFSVWGVLPHTENTNALYIKQLQFHTPATACVDRADYNYPISDQAVSLRISETLG